MRASVIVLVACLAVALSTPVRRKKRALVMDKEWGKWSVCSKSCDHGRQWRVLGCTEPSSGQYSPSCANQTASCNMQSCVDRYGFTDWTTCSATCNGGKRSRSATKVTHTEEIDCHTQDCKKVEGCGGADLYFVWDSSGSITESNFYRLKQFTIDVLKSLPMGNNETKVGLIQYATEVQVEWKLGNQPSNLEAGIWNVKWMAGATNTADALAELKKRYEIGYNRAGHKDIAIVITDGVSNIIKQNTIPNAQALHQMGVEVFAIGIGRIDDTELTGIASLPTSSHKFVVSDFDSLKHITSAIVNGTCEAASRVECDAWNSWSACSVTCGKGQQTRTQKCRMVDGMGNKGPDVDIQDQQNCDAGPCVVDYCASTPCQNAGTCSNGQNGHTCTCAPGFTGPNCETDINECTSDPCVNSATCTDIVNGYTCACAPGYTGTHCEININECASNPCVNSATCTDLVNGYTCACAPGYTGTHCEINIDECTSTPCVNGATCNDLVNGYTCQCAPGYTGTHCQTDIDECASNPCRNEATCQDLVNGYTCQCMPGYSGVHCEISMLDCANCKRGSDGIGYLPNIDNCATYIQCERRPDGTYNKHIMVCPSGLYWNQDILNCVGAPSFGYNCKFVSVTTGAPTTRLTTDAVCRLKSVAGEPNAYLNGNTKMMCAPGTSFDATRCSCITNMNAVPLINKCDELYYLPFDKDVQDQSCTHAWVGSYFARGWFDVNKNIKTKGCVKGGCMYFDGNTRLDIAHMRNRWNNRNQRQFTISVWVRRTAGSHLAGIVNNGDCVDTPSFTLRASAAATYVGGFDTMNSKDLKETEPISGMKADTWHHIVLIYNGAQIRSYLDGVLTDTKALTGGLENRFCPMNIGHTGRSDFDWATNTRLGFFEGYMDELRVYERALSAVEVDVLFTKP